MPAVEKGLIFNTGPYGDSPLKINILKSGFLHAREDQKIDPEPKFHVPRDLGPQMAKTMGIMKIHFGHCVGKYD